jgi:hypothetical protein
MNKYRLVKEYSRNDSTGNIKEFLKIERYLLTETKKSFFSPEEKIEIWQTILDDRGYFKVFKTLKEAEKYFEKLRVEVPEKEILEIIETK